MSEPLEITHEDDTWLVEGPWLQRLMANVNFGDYESRNWFDRMLRQSGLFDRLEEMGIQDGTSSPSITWNSSTSGKAERPVRLRTGRSADLAETAG